MATRRTEQIAASPTFAQLFMTANGPGRSLLFIAISMLSALAPVYHHIGRALITRFDLLSFHHINRHRLVNIH